MKIINIVAIELVLGMISFTAGYVLLAFITGAMLLLTLYKLILEFVYNKLTKEK